MTWRWAIAMRSGIMTGFGWPRGLSSAMRCCSGIGSDWQKPKATGSDWRMRMAIAKPKATGSAMRCCSGIAMRSARWMR